MKKFRSREWLSDVLTECGLIDRVTMAGARRFDSLDVIERHAVERSFEIIGEALSRLELADPDAAARVTRLRDIIGFRNQIAHGYDKVDAETIDRVIGSIFPG